MLKFYVRTTLERQLDSSYSQIEYELLVDTEHKPIESFIEQLEQISEYDSVLLEDDLILCKDFKNKIEEVINKYPNKIINFFYHQDEYYQTREAMEYSNNQCTYYPKGVGKLIAKEMKNFVKYSNQYSWIENLALRKLHFTHIQYRPCLVQHLDNGSLIQKHKIIRPRITPYFVDYLEELGISYEDACTKENRDKLINLMNEKFNFFKK